MANSAVESNKLVCAVAAGALIAGSFLSWAVVDAGVFHVSKSGVDGGDGWFTAGLGAFALWCFLVDTFSGGAVFCLLGGALAVYELVDVQNRIDDIEGSDLVQAKVGLGLYICLFGAAVGVIAGFVTHKQQKERATAEAGTATAPQVPM